MRSCLSFLPALFLSSAGWAQPLDLTVHRASVQEDGMPAEQTYFQKDPDTMIFIFPPRSWSVSSDSSRFSVISPDAPGASIKIEHSTFTPDQAFEGSGLNVYRKKVLTGPESATETTMLSEKEDAVQYCGWKAYEFTVGYQRYGDKWRQSYIFINLDAKEQLMVTTVAREPDYASVHEATFRMLLTWNPTAKKLVQFAGPVYSSYNR